MSSNSLVDIKLPATADDLAAIVREAVAAAAATPAPGEQAATATATAEFSAAGSAATSPVRRRIVLRSGPSHTKPIDRPDPAVIYVNLERLRGISEVDTAAVPTIAATSEGTTAAATTDPNAVPAEDEQQQPPTQPAAAAEDALLSHAEVSRLVTVGAGATMLDLYAYAKAKNAAAKEELNETTADPSNTTTTVAAGLSSAATAPVAVALPVSLKKTRSFASDVVQSIEKMRRGEPQFLSKSMGYLCSYVRSITAISRVTGEAETVSVGEFDAEKHFLASAVLDVNAAASSGALLTAATAAPETSVAAAPSPSQLITANVTVPYFTEAAAVALEQLANESKRLKDEPIDLFVELFRGAYGIPTMHIAAARKVPVGGPTTSTSAGGNGGNGDSASNIEQQEAALRDLVVGLLPEEMRPEALRAVASAEVKKSNDKTVAAAEATSSSPTSPASGPQSPLSASDFDLLRDMTAPRALAGPDAYASLYEEDALDGWHDNTVRVAFESGTLAGDSESNGESPSSPTNSIAEQLSRFDKDPFNSLRAYAAPDGSVFFKAKSAAAPSSDAAASAASVGAASIFDSYKPTCRNEWLARAGTSTQGLRIPNFKGKFFQKGDAHYDDARQQYAVSSYAAVVTEPFAICYPTDVDDVRACVDFARLSQRDANASPSASTSSDDIKDGQPQREGAQSEGLFASVTAAANNVIAAATERTGKSVVARSGGHQYCAKSSGGDTTVVVSLDTEPFQFIRPPTAEEDASLAHLDAFYPPEDRVVVGPGVKLIDVANMFCKLGLTVPHGECPFVCIGGHAQTGGYGHMTHTFGLCMDRVLQFDIVLENAGKTAGTRVVTVTRPHPTEGPKTREEIENNQLFHAVLSGNAGSFGIVTRYVFGCLANRSYPESKIYRRALFYTSDLFTSLLGYVKTVTQEIKDGTDEGPGGKGLDFTMTVASRGISLGKCHALKELILVEGVSLGNTACADQFAPFKAAIKKSNGLLKGFFEKILGFANVKQGAFKVLDQKMPLADIDYQFVRLPNAGTTADGREFDLPYKKRVNCTTSVLTDAFIKAFVGVMDKAMASNMVSIVFQMGLGGGAYKRNGGPSARPDRLPDTGIPHRDYTFCFVFDLFYDPSTAGSEAAAIGLQKDMQTVVDTLFNPDENGRELRVFWGSFGAADIAEESAKYYGAKDGYRRLQEAKFRFDPNDRFHTSLTVAHPTMAKDTAAVAPTEGAAESPRPRKDDETDCCSIC